MNIIMSTRIAEMCLIAVNVLSMCLSVYAMSTMQKRAGV